MPSVTQTDIANMALALLTEAPIASLDEDCRAARLLNTHWDTVLESELADLAPGFAVRSEELTGTDLETASDTLNWRYDMPDDAIRLLPLTYDGQAGGVPIDYRLEGDFIYSNQDSPRTVRYIALVVDPAEWSALFTDVVAAALAVKIAHALTAKQGMIQIAQAAYDKARLRCKRVDGVEARGTLDRTSWTVQRGDLRHGWR